MSSTVRNTFTTLMICSALVIGLVVAAPAALPRADVASATVEADVARVAMIAALTAEAPVVAGLASTFPHTAATPAAVQKSRHASGQSRRIRQSMAMPFFSFAPRG